MSSSEISDLKNVMERFAPVVNPAMINQLAERGIYVTVVTEDVENSRCEAVFKGEVDLCASRSVAGFFGEKGEFRRFNSIHEGKFDLTQRPEEFADFIYKKVIESLVEDMDLSNFLMGIEVFHTNADPNWGFPILQFNVRPTELDCCKILNHIRA